MTAFRLRTVFVCMRACACSLGIVECHAIEENERVALSVTLGRFAGFDPVQINAKSQCKYLNWENFRELTCLLIIIIGFTLISLSVISTTGELITAACELGVSISHYCLINILINT